MLRPPVLRRDPGGSVASVFTAVRRWLRCHDMHSAPLGSLLPSLAPLSQGRDAAFLPPRGPETLVPSRHFLDIYQVINKAAIEKERQRLSDEINRGYFADIKEFSEHGGKIAMANKTIIPSMAAMRFPDLEVNFSDGRGLKLPIDFSKDEDFTSEIVKPCASLFCLSFRASSQVMTDSWCEPFMSNFGASGKIQIYEVSFVDSWFLSLGPIRRFLLRRMKKSSCSQRESVYSFGDHYEFRKRLKILNLLSGYIYLLDKQGKIRWQGFGLATEEELSALFACTSFLLNGR